MGRAEPEGAQINIASTSPQAYSSVEMEAMMPATYYPAIVDRSASSYGVSFPDFPGCVANGATVNEAAISAEAALAFHVEAMVGDGDQIPLPSDAGAVFRDFGTDDIAGIMVRVDAPAKTARVLVSIDENLLRAIDAIAPNRSAFLAEAARRMLQKGPPSLAS